MMSSDESSTLTQYCSRVWGSNLSFVPKDQVSILIAFCLSSHSKELLLPHLHFLCCKYCAPLLCSDPPNYSTCDKSRNYSLSHCEQLFLTITLQQAKQRIIRALNIMTKLVIFLYFLFYCQCLQATISIYSFLLSTERANNFHRRRV